MTIRSKLAIYIFLTIIITFVFFGAWMLKKEKRQWESYQLEQTLSFTAFTSPEVTKLFGREVRSFKDEESFKKGVKELLHFNKDLIKFMILNVNGAKVYDSEIYVSFMTQDEIIEVGEFSKMADAESLMSEEQSFRIITLDSGRKVIDVITPVVHLTGRHILNIRYFISYNSVQKKFNAIRRDYFITAFMTLSLALLFLAVISSKITNPIYILTDKVKKMRAGDFNARVNSPTNDEIGELSNAFNDMVTTLKEDRENIQKKNMELLRRNVELKELHDQLIKSERLAAVGQLAAGISHEIDNPVGIILGYAEYIKSELGEDSPILDEIESIIHESKRCRRLTGGLLNFARSSPSFMQLLDLNDIAKETVSAVSMQSMFKLINIKEDYDHDLPVIMIDRDKMKQVLVNLFINASQSIRGDGEIIVSTRYINDRDNKYISLSIKDTGVGIPKENLHKIFDPFFTTKSSGKGTGLGLSICDKLIEEQNGKMDVRSKVNEGTTFTITLPV